MVFERHDGSGVALSNGRYQILATLGEGGMGTVYHARDRHIDADVVIKVPLRSMLDDPGFARRFRDETRAMVRLSHPHIVKVTDVGDWDGVPFAVMQYLPGGSLDDRRPIGPGGSVGAADPREVTKWLGGVASALDYVHEQGYVHRDVKPGNILFDALGHPFLGDFGVAKAVAGAAPDRAAVTGAGMVVGTVEYMARELILGEPFDGRADQYALATTVFEMLCGRRPFEDEVKTKVLVLQTTAPPPRPVELAGWIPGALSDAILKGLAKEPDGRYPTCAAFARAVTAAIEAGFAGQPERVRFRCPACGKVLAIPSADYPRLRRSGRSFACPACKAPFQLPAEGGAAPGPRRTMKERAGGAAPTLVERQARTLIEPGASGSGEVIELMPTGDEGYAVVPPPPPRRPPAPAVEAAAPGRTMVERSQGRPRGTMVEQSGLSPRPDGGEGPRTQAPWVAVGVSAVVSVSVLAIGLAWFSGRPKAGPGVTSAPPPAAPVAKPAPPVPETRSPTSGPLPTSPKPIIGGSIPSPNPAPGPVVTPKEPAALASNDAVAGQEADRPATPTPMPPELARAETVGSGTATLVQESKAEPEPPAPLRSLKGSVPLEKILKAPDLYANQMTALARTYCVGNPFTPQPDGSIRLPIIEGTLDLRFNNVSASIATLRARSFELDLDPKLAGLMIGRGLLRPRPSFGATTSWGDNVAIVTVAVVKRGDGEWAPRIVKFEFLVDIGPRVVVIAKNRRRRVVYETLTLSPEGEQRGEGKPDDWAQQDRVLHIANQFKNIIENQARQLSDAKWNLFNNQLNRMIGQAIRDNEVAPPTMPQPTMPQPRRVNMPRPVFVP